MLTSIDDFVYPFRALDALSREVNRFFEDAAPDAWPLVAVHERDAELLLTAEIPGVSPEAVDIKVEDDVVSLSFERDVKVPEQHTAHRRERAPFKVTRSFRLGTPVDSEKVSATLKDGLLRVSLPKAAPNVPKKITVRGA